MILVVILLDYMVLLQPGPLLEMLFCLFFSYFLFGFWHALDTISTSNNITTDYRQLRRAHYYHFRVLQWVGENSDAINKGPYFKITLVKVV